jgi:non-heme chloroperoxidase
VAESLKLPARVWRSVLVEGLLEPDFSPELAKIRTPTLIVWGDQDGLTRSGQAALSAALASPRAVTYAGAGHGVHWEEPGRFAADLAAFVRDLARPA